MAKFNLRLSQMSSDTLRISIDISGIMVVKINKKLLSDCGQGDGVASLLMQDQLHSTQTRGAEQANNENWR